MMIWKRNGCVCSTHVRGHFERLCGGDPSRPLCHTAMRYGYDVASPERAISINQMHWLIDRASSRSILGSPARPVRQAVSIWQYQIMAPWSCCSESPTIGSIGSAVNHDRPGLSIAVIILVPCRLQSSSRSQRPTLSFSLYEGNDIL